MTVTQQGATKSGLMASGTASVTFDATPTDGDLIVLCSSSSVTPTTPSGFASAVSSAAGREARIYFRIASSEAGAAYSVTGMTGTGAGIVGYVFRATNGFKTSAECTNNNPTGTGVTTITADPTTLPSNTTSVEVVCVTLAANAAAPITVAFNGGSTVTPTATGASTRGYGHFEIESSTPADVKCVFANATSTNLEIALCSFVEAAAVAAVNSGFFALL